MVAFLNERSLGTHTDLAASLELFWRIVSCAPEDTKLLLDGEFFQSGEFKQRFNHSFGQISPQLKGLARQMVFSDRYCKCWRPNRVSDPEATYHCRPPDELRSDCSISEGAERVILGETAWVGVLSAADSAFGQSDRIHATRTNDNKEVELFNVTNLVEWRKAISTQRGHFDPASNEVPRDFQTILGKDPVRFARTGKVERRFGRQIYKEIATGSQFYVDEGHPGHSAHLEVFDSQGHHLGVAEIKTGELDTTQKVVGRKLRL